MAASIKPVKFYVKGRTDGKEYLVYPCEKSDSEQLKLLRVEARKDGNTVSLLHQSNNDIPFCECPDWKKFQLPCKHLLVVMKKYEMTWYNFPQRFQDSPFFQLDKDFFSPTFMPTIHQASEEHVETEHVETSFYAIPKKIYPKRTAASTCRELLKEIKDIAYIVYTTVKPWKSLKNS